MEISAIMKQAHECFRDYITNCSDVTEMLWVWAHLPNGNLHSWHLMTVFILFSLWVITGFVKELKMVMRCCTACDRSSSSHFKLYLFS